MGKLEFKVKNLILNREGYFINANLKVNLVQGTFPLDVSRRAKGDVSRLPKERLLLI